MQIGKPAPNFSGTAVTADKEFAEIKLENYRGKWVVLFFYPLDFTFVCPTEIRGFDKSYGSFRDADAEVIGCSVDSHFSHLSWIERDFKRLSFPLLLDITKEISKAYNVLIDEGFSLRGTFIIDPNGILKSIVVNDNAVGRSIEETLRTLKALQTDKLTPCGWQPGDEFVPVPA